MFCTERSMSQGVSQHVQMGKRGQCIPSIIKTELNWPSQNLPPRRYYWSDLLSIITSGGTGFANRQLESNVNYQNSKLKKVLKSFFIWFLLHKLLHMVFFGFPKNNFLKVALRTTSFLFLSFKEPTNYKEPFVTTWKVHWMLKVLYWTIQPKMFFYGIDKHLF